MLRPQREIDGDSKLAQAQSDLSSLPPSVPRTQPVASHRSARAGFH